MKTSAGKIQQPPPERADERPAMIDDGALGPVDREVNDYAKRLFEAFYRETARVQKSWNYGECRPPEYSKDRQRKWQRMAKKLRAAGIANPEGYVHQQFMHGRTRQPNQMVSQEAIEKYEERVQVDREQQRLAWKTERQEFIVNSQILAAAQPSAAPQEIMSQVLSNTGYSLSHLFRYCVAVKNGLADVATTFHQAALQQLLTDTEGYASNWAGKIPPQLLEEAAGILGTSNVRGN